MDNLSILTYLLTAVVSLASYFWFDQQNKKKNAKSRQREIIFNSGTISVDAPQELRIHNKEFHQDIIKIKDKIHVAIGYGLANSILVEGNSECVLIDTLECESAINHLLYEGFNSILESKPISAIILTHFHADHTFGIKAVLKRYPKAKVYAQEK